VEAGLQQRLAEDMVAAGEQLVVLSEQREKIGRGDGFDAALARANAETLRDSVVQLSLAREQSLRALETLIGRYPSATVDIASELAKWPGPGPGGIALRAARTAGPTSSQPDRRIATAFLRTRKRRPHVCRRSS
jgi:outer membrane protein TolC